MINKFKSFTVTFTGMQKPLHCPVSLYLSNECQMVPDVNY